MSVCCLWGTALEHEQDCQMGRNCRPDTNPANLGTQTLISVRTATCNRWGGKAE